MASGRRPTSITQADLDSRLLRYFLAVVREGSLRKAADTLNVAASAISRQVTDLELRLGLPLLKRLPRGVVPTEAGRAIAEHARQQVDEGDRLLDYLRQLHGLHVGAVRVRCGEGFVGDLMDNALDAFSDAYPAVRIQLTLGGSVDIMDSVAEGRVDVGLAYNPGTRAGVRSAVMARQPMQLMAAPGHALAARRRISLKAAAGQPSALLSGDHGIRQLLALVEADQGFHLVPHLEAGSIDIVRRFAASGRGVTFLPTFAAAGEVASGRLVAVPLTDAVLAEAGAHLLIRSQRRLPGTVEKLVGFLSTRMRAFAAAARDVDPAGT